MSRATKLALGGFATVSAIAIVLAQRTIEPSRRVVPSAITSAPAPTVQPVGNVIFPGETVSVAEPKPRISIDKTAGQEALQRARDRMLGERRAARSSVPGGSSVREGTKGVDPHRAVLVEDVIENYEIETGVTVIYGNNLSWGATVYVNPSAINTMTGLERVEYYKAVLLVNGFSVHEYSPTLHSVSINGCRSCCQ